MSQTPENHTHEKLVAAITRYQNALNAAPKDSLCAAKAKAKILFFEILLGRFLKNRLRGSTKVIRCKVHQAANHAAFHIIPWSTARCGWGRQLMDEAQLGHLCCYESNGTIRNPNGAKAKKSASKAIK